MKPLHPDRVTDRAETVAYLTLAVAALAGVLLAVPTSVGFGNTIDPVTARLQCDGEGPEFHFAAPDSSVATNLAQGRVQPLPAEAITPTNPALAAPRTIDAAEGRTAG
jgi:hypothetical protein